MPFGVAAPLTAGAAFTAWQFAPLVSSGLALFAIGYLLGVWRLRARRGRPWPAGRTLAFFLGLGVIAVATQSSIGVYDDVLFSDHMVQHVLLIMVVAPLLVYGRPVTLGLVSASGPLRAWIKRVVRSRAVAALTWPPAATALYCVVVASTHTPPVMDLVLGNGTVHDLEHALYLVAGYLFFLPVIGSEPIRWRTSLVARYLMLLVAMMTDSFTGAVFTFQSREIFAPYARTGRAWGPGLVADLHAGGLVMLAGSDAVMAVVALGLAVRFVRDSLRGAARETARPADGDARLAAYNAYLRGLSGSGPGRGDGGGREPR